MELSKRPAIMLLQKNKKAAMLGTFFLICKNFPLFQEICKDATLLVSKIALVFTHVASSYAYLLFKFWL